jgi:uncharacterized protein
MKRPLDSQTWTWCTSIRTIPPVKGPALDAALSNMRPEFCWEAVNQASVHRWLKTQPVDQIVQPCKALEEGMGSWPERATCAGAMLIDTGNFQVIALHGFNNLFAMIVLRNPACVSKEPFQRELPPNGGICAGPA